MNGPINHSIVEIDLDNETGLLSSIPEGIGRRFETSVGGVASVTRSPGSMMFRTNAEFASVLLAPVPNMESAFASDRVQVFDAPVGTLIVNPSNVDRVIRWSVTKQNAAIAFSKKAYTDLATAELDGGNWELQPPRFGHVDPTALRIAAAMAAEISDRAMNTLYLDSLFTIFGIHLIRTYSQPGAAGPAKRKPLPKNVAKQVIEYMHAHLAESVTITDLTRICGLSPSYFIRAFTLTFGVAPYQYLTMIRLDWAERLLIETTLTIEDVALQCGFSSQSHLTNMMKRFKHVTPGQIIRTRRPAQR
jgi:AraC family transcriptional regulator